MKNVFTKALLPLVLGGVSSCASLLALSSCSPSGPLAQRSLPFGAAPLRIASELVPPCRGPSLGIIAPQRKITRNYKAKLFAVIVEWHFIKTLDECFPGWRPTVARWQSTGGHLSAKRGRDVYFWSGHHGKFVISARHPGFDQAEVHILVRRHI